ncbi:3-beta hydroxysteroid dehydrogenase [Georgenia sp. Z1491]|uniref:3-beta hydroxysteroid dehydrogenase n=1 Tax=Georgenia sp. Z1491 TaxID=3416707 RepID=UPI003CF6AEBB
MRVAIVGGGISGRAIQRAVTDRGGAAVQLSRSTGYDVICHNPLEHLRGYDVIIEAASRFTTSARAATDFFTRSTTAVARAANAGGARHVLLSIVGCELPEVQGYGYFAGKAAQERMAAEVSEHLVVVRSSQWFEFAEQNLGRMRLGPLVAVPTMRIRPVALDAVADVLADCALARRAGDRHDLVGPEELTLWDMTRRVAGNAAGDGRRIRPFPLPLPGRMGRAFRDGTLGRAPGAEVVGPTFEEWLVARG